MRPRRWIGAGVTLVLVLGVAAPALPQGGAAASAAIRVFQFQPGALGGSRRHPRHVDERGRHPPHGDLGPAGKPGRAVRRPARGKGTSGSASFSAPGAYPYFCTRHPSMRGEIVVR